MDLAIKNRVALVAAASRGLGKAVALQLAREGARVAVCSRSAESITRAAREITDATGAAVLPLECDVTDTAQVERMVAEVVSTLGGIEILVTNAGGPPAGMHIDFSTDDYRAAAELNLFSTVELVYAALPSMKQVGWGRIIAITSIAARQPVGNLILSNTARAGVLGFIKSLSAQVAGDGITANSVCPGFTDTERIGEIANAQAAAGRGSVQDFYKSIETDIPTGRMATPEEFAMAVAFLASEGAASINGIALPIDGGMSKGLY